MGKEKIEHQNKRNVENRSTNDKPFTTENPGFNIHNTVLNNFMYDDTLLAENSTLHKEIKTVNSYYSTDVKTEANCLASNDEVKIFNTVFESSLRVLIILSVSNIALSTDKIIAIDFTTIYGKDFGISDFNLHGDSIFRYAEIPARRDLIRYAIKDLVVKGLITPNCLLSGFTYTIAPSGSKFVKW